MSLGNDKLDGVTPWEFAPTQLAYLSSVESNLSAIPVSNRHHSSLRSKVDYQVCDPLSLWFTAKMDLLLICCRKTRSIDGRPIRLCWCYDCSYKCCCFDYVDERWMHVTAKIRENFLELVFGCSCSINQRNWSRFLFGYRLHRPTM